MAANDRRIALRAPADLYEQAEKIQLAIARQGIPVKTADVLRMALERGLKVLERKYRRR